MCQGRCGLWCPVREPPACAPHIRLCVFMRTELATQARQPGGGTGPAKDSRCETAATSHRSSRLGKTTTVSTEGPNATQ